MKKILLGILVAGAVGGVAMLATNAFFSDTETSTGNTFQAGALDLTVDYMGYYNKLADGNTNAGYWTLKDLTSEKFFNLTDVKPGDFGEGTISLHLNNNNAWGCVTITPTANDDVSSTEPELAATDVADDTGNLWDGELAQNMQFRIWADTCANAPATPGDNIYQEGCDKLLTAGPAPITPVTWALADSVTPNIFTSVAGPLVGNATYYIGAGWTLPKTVGNIVQTDNYKADISFYTEQERNNLTFVCPGVAGPSSVHISLENKDAQWSIIANDNTYGDIQYSSNAHTFNGIVTGTGLAHNGKYQITLNGPGGCTFTDAGFAGVSLNAFSSGYWNNGTNLEPTCGTPGQGVYNMNLISNWYTFIADGSGAFSYPFNFALPAGNYIRVKVLVKKMLEPFVSPWADLGAGYPAFNLYETAPISFTIN